ncbi:hypothetical protein PsorP6_017144 [Peronosclerospora sorghi]|uniref:Uncharacterized protein n=1 Tax=Peronosclerospora sorghi TaxID=230839 RepID=A0ACC0WC95_9STRA|nr:hypothetical protein PsorP6_017144 [Peronosclerospora sorghi]
MVVLTPAERCSARQYSTYISLEELRKLNARRKFRAALSTVKATISLMKVLAIKSGVVRPVVKVEAKRRKRRLRARLLELMPPLCRPQLFRTRK